MILATVSRTLVAVIWSRSLFGVFSHDTLLLQYLSAQRAQNDHHEAVNGTRKMLRIIMQKRRANCKLLRVR